MTLSAQELGVDIAEGGVADIRDIWARAPMGQSKPNGEFALSCGPRDSRFVLLSKGGASTWQTPRRSEQPSQTRQAPSLGAAEVPAEVGISNASTSDRAAPGASGSTVPPGGFKEYSWSVNPSKSRLGLCAARS